MQLPRTSGENVGNTKKSCNKKGKGKEAGGKETMKSNQELRQFHKTHVKLHFCVYYKKTLRLKWANI